ncbi:MBL fold metallo-hydrolase [Dyadobacter frigoris]|uniref:Zn-dependent hydrolase n=1 Tax=Dyadobacter frigoris TaxID=2576211 RepID=A0A4U6D0F2_9BACT|nr:MBL fold metallo-hydrolase [Dyadobacter frigoris]TKT90552.1 Zn-dependent hydrolase [Dyadobacter frigoris]GLU51306.1 membrane protein [Dyadobacter frigoris]
MTNPASKYLSNPDLKTPKAPEGWQGTPVDAQGRFMNLNHTFSAELKDVLRWKFQRNPFKEQKREEIWNPVIFRDNSWLETTDDIFVWLGHSTFYIRIGGITILTDPVFGDILSVKRLSEFPVDIHRLVNLDYILLSHDHRDHLDKKSLNILSKQNPDVRYLTGLHMKELVKEFTASDNTEEAGWYQQYNTDNQPIKITFVPSRHWSKRGLFDTNFRLWGGFVIEAKGKRILFGGDSGYDTHYKQMAAVFGSFDYAILGIGAYAPEWFMSPNHQSPKDALKAFTELNAKYYIPMHYGTFDLSDEPLGEPLKQLLTAAENEHPKDKLIIPLIGRPVEITG